MNFGTSLSDIVIVVNFCKALYRRCEDAGGEYEDISNDVRGLYTVFKHLNYEAEAPESPLNRDHKLWERQLAPIVRDCDSTLRQLDDLLQRYGITSSNGEASKVKLGSNDLNLLGAIRVKLINQRTSLSRFMDTIQLQYPEMGDDLGINEGQLEVILDKVDKIAERMAKRNSYNKSNHKDDDREVWKQFQKELVAEGFSSEVLEEHKDVLRGYIRAMDQEGLLDAMPSARPLSTLHEPINSQPRPIPINQASRGGHSQLSSSFGTAATEDGAKQMMTREEDMKFDPSIKWERPKPESRTENRSTGINSGPIPRLTRSSDEKDEEEVQYMNTSGSSESDSSSSSSRRHRKRKSKPPQMALVIRTRDLFAPGHALQLLPPGSPSSYRSNQSSFNEDTFSHRPKKSVEFGTSPARPGAIPIPSAPNDRFGTSPGKIQIPSSAPRLAPDEHGNEIPLDAKWTKINRRLVSPEVLDQDRRRYEARPDFVAVLGVLSREEIASLAARSAEIREARKRRGAPPHHAPSKSQQAPPQPPRPIPVPIPIPISHHRHGRETPSDSETDYSSGPEHRNRRPQPRRRGYAGSDISGPKSGYPNPHGAPVQGPPSPMASPDMRDLKGRGLKGSHPVQPPRPGAGKDGSKEGGFVASRLGHSSTFPQSSNDREREREKERERERERNRIEERRRTEPRRDRDRNAGWDDERERNRDREREREREEMRMRERERDRERDRERERAKLRERVRQHKNSRWKQNLTAAGIGASAVRLLDVLSEAAEGF